jgi:hypothetical protein
MLDTFRDNVNLEGIRVHPPKPYVLLCGGEVSTILAPAPISIRDAFLRGNWQSATAGSDILQIEEIQEFFEKDSPYDDLVLFERDIAQISELVLLFSEGPGSFAELGAFSLIEEIREKLLVVIQRKYIARSSFISKGPVASLRRDFKKSVYSIIDRRLGIVGDNIGGISVEILVGDLIAPVQNRLIEARTRTTLDISKFSHICKIYVGLLFEFYSLIDDELIDLLSFFGFDCNLEVLNKVAFCCAALRWSATTTSGFERVHFALPGNEAAEFRFQKKLSDKIRRRTMFREHWEAEDPIRVAAVDEGLNR